MFKFWPLSSKRSAPPLAPEVNAEVVQLVRAGFYDKARLLQIFCEEKYAPGEVSQESVSAAIDEAKLTHAKDQQTWPDTTDCDRLERAFTALWQRGVVALENAGNTQSDGYGDVQRARDEHPDPSTLIGYCFYHSQDLEAAVEGLGLRLAFGPMDPTLEQSDGPAIGQAVCTALREAGLEPEWDGSFNQRIRLPQLNWQRKSC